MRLINLNLTNFQGIRDARFDFSGANANIYGDNATGKTTLFNAVTWLLFGKASTGAKNFTPKTKAQDGDVHYLDHGVEAKFALEDGQLLALKKVYKEDYKTKRGSSQKEFNGHVVDYFLDGVPVKEKEFAAALTEYFGPVEKMTMLMQPDYFPEVLHWEQRRRILLEMCGDVSDEDVITGNPRLGDLLEFLAVPGTVGKHYTVEEYKKIAASKRTEINRELQLIPARIDEARKAMPDVSGLSAGPINAKLTLLNSHIESKEREKQEAFSGDATADTIRKEISALNTKIAEARAAYATENSKTNETALAEVNRLRMERSRLQSVLSSKEAQLNAAHDTLSSLTNMREKITAEWQRVYDKAWEGKETWDGDETCPSCLRPLPEKDIAEAKENFYANVAKAKEEFNENKSKQLEAINAEGAKRCSKDMVAAAKAEISTIEGEIAAEKTSLTSYDTLIAEAEKKIVSPPPFESTETYTSLTAEITALQTDESKASSTVSNQISLWDKQISELRQQVDDLQAKKSNISLAEHQQKRIDELSADEKRLSGEFENIERGVFLCEEFIKAKVSMLTDKINGKFASVRFRLFIEQINGGIKEDCEVMVPGDGKMVPYTFANNAARINAGLEIINALAQHWGISVPVFVDNAEGVTRLQEIDGQLIRLVVSEPDKVLRMEAA